MTNRKFLLGMLVLALVFGMAVVGCGGKEDDPALTGTVSIAGTAQVGQTLTANTSSLGGSGTISYQWKRAGTTNIGTNSSTYIVQTADVGSTIAVTVTRAGYSGSVTSTATAAVSASDLTGTVSITGTAQVGQTLTANTSSLGGSGTISYQWKRGDTADAVNTNIYSATESTYLLTADDFGKFVALSVTRSGHNVSSTAVGPVADAMTWVQVNTGTISLNGVAYNGTNQWVVVGDNARLMYSGTVESWTPVNNLNTIFIDGTTVQSINSIAYGNGKWVAVGGYGKAASSTDGTTWAAITMTSPSPFGTQNVNSVVYANNRWVAGGARGLMGTSTDNGVTWTSVTGDPFGSSAINSIAYGNNRWIAVGDSGKMATSTDGTDWTAIDVTSIFTYTLGGSSTVQPIETVAYANNQWIAAGGGGIMATSTNGTSWAAVTGNPLGTATIQTVTYGNNRWVAAGGFTMGLMSSRIAVSTDGKNWSSVANTTFGNSEINGIAFGNNKWVAVGDDSKIAYANDD